MGFPARDYMNWRENIIAMMNDDPKNRKQKFLKSVQEQGDKYGWQHVPTRAQLRILEAMYAGWERRRAESILGEDLF